ncbi:MAG: MarR family transcriptional regulator [Solirubrobacterales bacterium]|nr:MarR family transcriptional regulator [Solirubrobacterales bacterium]
MPPRREPPRRQAPGRPGATAAAEALVAVAPLVSRWMERLLAAHEPSLTLAQFEALLAIAGERVSGSELARRAGVSGPAVSQLLAGLTAAGLLERRELSEDRRRQQLTLSRQGRRAVSSARALLSARVSALLAELPPPEADALARALPHVHATLGGSPPPRRPPHPPHARHPPPPPPAGRRM